MGVKDLIAVSSMNGVGAIVFWRLSGLVNYPAFVSAWIGAGRDPDELPPAPTSAVALRAALTDLEGPHTLARAMPTRGEWAVVDERVVGGQLEYTTALTVCVHPNGSIRTTYAEDDDSGRSEKLIAAYKHFSRHLSPAMMGSWLVAQVEKCGGVRLKDTGGVYFIPRWRLAAWQRLATAVMGVSSHEMLEIPAMSSAEATAAVTAALVAESAAALDSVQAQIDGGALGSRALETRVWECGLVAAKLRTYEVNLGIQLESLRDRAEALQVQISVAVLAAEGKKKSAKLPSV